MLIDGADRKKDVGGRSDMVTHHMRNAYRGQRRYDEGKSLKLAEHTLSDAEIASGKMAVPHVVHAFDATIISTCLFCVDMQCGEQQHRHEYCQEYP